MSRKLKAALITLAVFLAIVALFVVPVYFPFAGLILFGLGVTVAMGTFIYSVYTVILESLR